MGFLGGGFFGSGAKADSGNTKQSNFTLGNTQDFTGANGINSSIAPVTIEIGDKNKNTTVNTTIVDGGAIRGAFDAVDGAFELINNTLTGQTYMFDVFAGGMVTASDGANALSELAIMQAGEQSSTFMSLAGDIVESNANLGAAYGDNLAYLTDTSIAGNQFLTEKSMEMADIAMSNNASLARQYGADLTGLNSQYNNNLTDLTSQTQNTLLEMAQLQEAGLDNALQIAGSLGMEDNSEASVNMVKFVMLGVGALAVAMVIKK